jgi:hypothetical protein
MLGKVSTGLDRRELVLVKQAVKLGVDHLRHRYVNWPLARLIGIVRIPLSPPL